MAVPNDLMTSRASTILSTQAFEEFYKNNLSRPSSSQSDEDSLAFDQESTDDFFDSILPGSGSSGPIAPHRQHEQESRVGTGNSGNSHGGKNQPKQFSISNFGLRQDAQSVGDDGEHSFGDMPPMLRSGVDHARSLSENSTSVPGKSSSRTATSIPTRRSSRARGESTGSSANFSVRGSQSSQRQLQISASEIEAARRVLAAAELNGYEFPQGSRKASVQTERSATPPPIGRARRAGDSGSDSDTAHSLRPIAPDTSFFLQNPSSVVTRRHSHNSLASHTSQNKSAARAHSIIEQPQFGAETVLFPPGTRDISRPRSRKEMTTDNDQGHVDGRLFHTQFSMNSRNTNSIPRRGTVATSSSRRPGSSSTKRALHDDSFFSPTDNLSKQHSIMSSSSSATLPEFFSYEIFKTVLSDPTTAHQLLKFSRTRLCSENIEFLNKVDEYQKALLHLSTILGSIHKGFISSDSTRQLDVPHELIRSIQRDVKALAGRTLPGMEGLFADMQARIEELVFEDVYPRFIRHQLALSATQALASDRHRYAGLGDCFCLTNPSKADNPIVFASDGFVKVTGYSRPEIIPRNCRFLQGLQTDRTPIERLKQGIADRRESVELILNYKKNGDPFWNLLYVAPLYDANGKLSFYIGGQVNCSTTIHNNADIMRVLSSPTPGDMDDPETSSIQSPHNHKSPASTRKAFLKALGVRVDQAKVSAGPPGMEQDVLNRMEGQNLDVQMKEFYTAYSKYIVVQANTFMIAYYSEGVVEALNPVNNTGLVAGQDVFRFFKQNMISKETDYRSRVRSAIRAGSPISVELRLQTRRSAKFRGDEVFNTHWTPLKNEKAETHWVVIALASMIQ
ncbi:hypothetical protein PFICI_14037 [Pestalotiopsis fici W106-1]|uniref:RGS domain-containing protein n=1 Tax=Pestalotiopsis fici (strain W106-1 / CGMCC3.15140) TaxID=1229662 RepID=W3WMY0_PESFW|nr:uncharacterized protein PFICI_14037 [Pestalotiopsis fici W106-1]ETS74171.1 hypothetical protein PFICI_14037 [Pestalotiopsis fici W106-1]